MKPHKHSELIKAWADGAEIEEYQYEKEYPDYGFWLDVTQNPHWGEFNEYRIKPAEEKKPDIVKVFVLEVNNFAGLRFSESTPIEFGTPCKQFIKCYFDGKTYKLKSAEVLK